MLDGIDLRVVRDVYGAEIHSFSFDGLIYVQSVCMENTFGIYPVTFYTIDNVVN